MNQPLVVYVSGSPGSGKTTLAKLLSERLYVPHVSSDLIHGGIAYSHNTLSREMTLHEVFVPLLITLCHQGVSFVVDQVLQRGISEHDIIDKIKPYATVVNVHTQTADPIGRYVARIKSSSVPHIQRRQKDLLDRAVYHESNLANTNDPLDLGVASIVVNTDHDYAPDIENIVQFIEESY